ncbi:MAG: excinuclease ABC subunit UvrC [Deltaproteobacteria bacterium]|nr:excinuclease ABC subunit UvrC [Deltaproteobacteria bacterium]
MEEKLNNLPTNPGVYLFKDAKGTVLYVGKAGNIKHRVSSYFQRAGEKDAKTLALLEKVADIETILTDTEKEALILEDNLIKEHHPRYNIKLRDDKRYPCLRLSVEEDFPTLSIVRRIKKDRSIYFGPYPSATSLKETLKLIRRLFPIRTCRHTKFSNRIRPCINYEMERCSGPCCGKIDPAQYGEIIRQVRMFLEGRNRDLIESLKRRMEEAAEQLHFEKAARIRDQIEHIERVIERQNIVSRDFIDRDVIGFHRQDHRAAVYSLFIRAGKLLGGKGFNFSSISLPDEEILSSFLRQYYREDRFIPEQILIPKHIFEKNLSEGWLTELKGKKVCLLVPQKGAKRKLLEMASDNAEKFLRREAGLEEDRENLLLNLKESLHLSRVPKRIEAFDISNLQGGQAVGSMVSFEDGEPNKDRYRHFKIKTVEGSDDYGMMYEVLLRRYQKAVEEMDLPDLVLVDGGKGQLNVAKEVFKELGIKEVDLLSLAKARRVGHAETSDEKVFHPQYKEPITLGKQSPLLRFLDQIRDEAHRFAITYHKKVRQREAIYSALGEIPGIGKTRQRELLKYFGSVEKIKEATLEELGRVPKITPKSARSVYDFFLSSQPEKSTT